MNLLNFAERFPDEQTCRSAFKEYRDIQGVICPKCGHKEHYWLSAKESYQCKECKTRQGLRSHTVMHSSHLPFRYWFVAIHLLTSTKQSFSASELQRQLGHKRYEPIWQMVNKIRGAMGKHDELYELRGVVELDEGFFTTEVGDDEKDKPLKPRRGSQRKTKVMVESKPIEGKTTNKGKPREVGHLKMIVINNLLSQTIDSVVKPHIDKGSIIDSDDSTSYPNLKI